MTAGGDSYGIIVDDIEDEDAEEEETDSSDSEEEEDIKSAESNKDDMNLEIADHLVSTLKTKYRRALEESYFPKCIFRTLVVDIENIHKQFCLLYRSNFKPESFSSLENLFYATSKELIVCWSATVYGSQPAKVGYLYALIEFAAPKRKEEQHFAWTRGRLNEFLDLCQTFTRYDGSKSKPTNCFERYILETFCELPQELINPNHSLLIELLQWHINARSPCKSEALGLLRAASKSSNTIPLLAQTLPKITWEILSKFPSSMDFNLLPTIYLTILPRADPAIAPVRLRCLELLRDRILGSIDEMELNPEDEEMTKLNASLESFYKTRGIEILAKYLKSIPIPLVFILFLCIDLVDDKEEKLIQLNASLLEEVDADVASQLLSLWGVLVPVSFQQLDKGERAWNWVMSERMKLNRRISKL